MSLGVLCLHSAAHGTAGLSPGAQSIGGSRERSSKGLAAREKRQILQKLTQIGGVQRYTEELRQALAASDAWRARFDAAHKGSTPFRATFKNKKSDGDFLSHHRCIALCVRSDPLLGESIQAYVIESYCSPIRVRSAWSDSRLIIIIVTCSYPDVSP